MPPPIYVLNEEDVAVLRRLIAESRSTPRGVRVHPASRETEDIVAPDVYIARVPPTGIPALDLGEETGTGTGSGDTGDDVPGYADCQFYQIINTYPGDTGPPSIEVLDMGEERVHNLSQSAIPGGTWVLAIRDKTGAWIAQTTDTTPENDSVSVAQWRYDCDQGILKAYRRFITYRVGELPVIGPEEYHHDEGCCECSGDTGTGAVDEPLCCTEEPLCLTFPNVLVEGVPYQTQATWSVADAGWLVDFEVTGEWDVEAVDLDGVTGTFGMHGILTCLGPDIFNDTNTYPCRDIDPSPQPCYGFYGSSTFPYPPPPSGPGGQGYQALHPGLYTNQFITEAPSCNPLGLRMNLLGDVIITQGVCVAGDPIVDTETGTGTELCYSGSSTPFCLPGTVCVALSAACDVSFSLNVSVELDPEGGTLVWDGVWGTLPVYGTELSLKFGVFGDGEYRVYLLHTNGSILATSVGTPDPGTSSVSGTLSVDSALGPANCGGLVANWIAAAECLTPSGDTITTECCPDDPLPLTLIATVPSGVCAGDYEMVYNAGHSWWEATIGGITAIVFCDSGTWKFSGSSTVTADSVVCNPLEIVFPGLTSGTCLLPSVTITAPA